MKLFPYDAYRSLTRIIPCESPIVFVDVGANEGQTIARVREEFKNATIHAFEPSPETFARLERAAAGDPNVHVYPMACGSKSGTVDFHVTNNHWCSSVLPPSELGRRLYGEWYRTREVVRVPVTTLDEWAAKHSIDRIDVLKVDAQGYDLEVLNGARRLLASEVKAVNCECHFAPEYEGCATFSQIDLFLAGCGFALHQLHEIHDRGDEEQTTYADGLWLRVEVLEALRVKKDRPDLSPKGRVRSALAAAARAGRRRAALYGSGRHTTGIEEFLDEMPLPITAIIDDDPALQGTMVAGREVIGMHAVADRGIDVVVLSSDVHEAALWEKTVPLRCSGIEVTPLYNKGLEPLIESKPNHVPARTAAPRTARMPSGTPFAHIEREFFAKAAALGFIPKCVVDVGGAEGSWSAAIAEVFPETRFELFEPLVGQRPDYDEILRRHMRSHPRFRMHPVALGSENGTAEFWNQRYPEGSSLLVKNAPAEERMIVRVRRLDDFIEERGIPQPELVKMDVQGSEAMVIRGGAKTIEAADMLHIETWLGRAYGPETPLLPELMNLLRPLGHVLVHLGEHWRKPSEELAAIDAFFAHQRLIDRLAAAGNGFPWPPNWSYEG